MLLLYIKKGNSEILSSKKWRKKRSLEKIHLFQNLIFNFISIFKFWACPSPPQRQQLGSLRPLLLLAHRLSPLHCGVSVTIAHAKTFIIENWSNNRRFIQLNFIFPKSSFLAGFLKLLIQQPKKLQNYHLGNVFINEKTLKNSIKKIDFESI